MIQEVNYRLPAEWEPQQAVLLTWPHAATDWAYCLADITDTSVEQHLVYLLPGHTPKVVDLGTVQPTQSTQ